MRKLVAALVASGALAAGSVAAVSALSVPAIAQESTPTPESSESPGNGNGSGASRECNHGLTALVEDGTITQAQADAISEALREARESGRIPARGEGDREAKLEAMRAVLAELVSAGTITQAQADAVIAAKGSHAGRRGPAEAASFRPLFGSSPTTT